jgi:hypothetical protein
MREGDMKEWRLPDQNRQILNHVKVNMAQPEESQLLIPASGIVQYRAFKFGLNR